MFDASLTSNKSRVATYGRVGIGAACCACTAVWLRRVVRRAEALPVDYVPNEVEINLIRQGGFGILSQTQPPRFGASQVDDAADFFHANGYVVIDQALSSADVAFLNDFFERSQKEHPERWGLVGRARKQPYVKRTGLIYSQPLLDHPELDRFTQHQPTFTIVEKIMCKAKHEEFNLRESPEGIENHHMNIHRDKSLPARYGRPDGEPVDYMNCITYLTEVTEETPAFCVVPGSG